MSFKFLLTVPRVTTVRVLITLGDLQRLSRRLYRGWRANPNDPRFVDSLSDSDDSECLAQIDKGHYQKLYAESHCKSKWELIPMEHPADEYGRNLSLISAFFLYSSAIIPQYLLGGFDQSI